MSEQTISIDAVDELMADPQVQRALRMILVCALEKGMDVAQEIMERTAAELEAARRS